MTSSRGDHLLLIVARLNRWATRRAQLPAPAAQLRLLSLMNDLGPSRIGDLAVADNSSQPTMTTQVQRLEADGLVTRTPDSDDRRSVIVEITPAGRAAWERVAHRWSSEEGTLFDGLSTEELRTLNALLRKANDELGTTVVVITHEMDVVRSLADRVAVLDAGRLVEHGTVRDIFTAPEADATRRIVGATLDIEPDAEQAEHLEAAHTGRVVTVTANPGENLGVVLGNVGRTGVGLEFVHGGVTRIKDDDLTTFTLNLTGPTDAVDGVVAELAQIATVKEVA